VRLEEVAAGLTDPVNAWHAGDGTGRLFVVERTGRVRVVQDGQLLPDPFLDLSQTVMTDHLEQGLLDIAFHPRFAENGNFFVSYTERPSNGDLIVARYAVSADDPNRADPGSGRVVLRQDKPYQNHNGGKIKFGPNDGYLYVSVGDGGLAGDPYDNAQALDTLLGKILRIDVDGGDPYAIPSDNPFATSDIYGGPDTAFNYHPDARKEIWAYGLRNPWQFSFDRATGDLYVADVGQLLYEEVNFQPAGSAGGVNYGWDYREGTHCYPEGGAPTAEPGAPGSPTTIREGVIEAGTPGAEAQVPNQPVTQTGGTGCADIGVRPVAEYSHADGGCSITGIGAYRGQASPELTGSYLFSDFCTGKLFATSRNAAGVWNQRELLAPQLRVTGAGEDEAGELYVTTCECNYNVGYVPGPTGKLWRIVTTNEPPAASPAAPAATVPAAAPAAEAGGGPDVTVEMIDIAFRPTEIEIPAGQDVTFSFPNTGATVHDFTIDELGLKVVVQPGDTGALTINAPAGTYEFYCSVPGHRPAGMVGTLTVR
jgi:uncharacterized cupredoxin-like copper-binding protein